ncbi:MAG: ATP-binding cassette domain-containing protein [Bacteroidales bacterium]|nr:ATP-binding cassette domain-containing protein [Bacteroidales bacterium]
MNLFSAKEITKHYANVTALQNVSIEVPQQSIFGLLGPNGAGKTTLIRIINQIIAPDNGTLLFDGRKLEAKDIFQIGYLPEERGLYKKMKVSEQSIYLAQLKGLSKQEAVKRLKYWFEKLNIESWWNKKVEELSKGMQQKIQFVVTIIHNPKLLIFDEPFSGLDPINVNIIKNEILNLRNQGATVIFSTHNMASVEELCDYIALINNSETILQGKMKDIKKAYKSNTYEVLFNNFKDDIKSILNPDFTLIEQNKDEDLIKAKIQIPKTYTSNDLIQTLLPHVSIHSFIEVLPTMNDIFIKKVNEN